MKRSSITYTLRNGKNVTVKTDLLCGKRFSSAIKRLTTISFLQKNFKNKQENEESSFDRTACDFRIFLEGYVKNFVFSSIFFRQQRTISASVSLHVIIIRKSCQRS